MKMRLVYFMLCCTLSLGIPPRTANADQMMMARINMDFPEAMLKLQDGLKKQGYTISRVQRVDLGLTKSGYKSDKYRVVFYGKLDEVKLISKNFPALIPYLPLKIAMFAEGSDTLLIAANPLILAPNASKVLKPYLLRWENDLQKLLTSMKTPSD